MTKLQERYEVQWWTKPENVDPIEWDSFAPDLAIENCKHFQSKALALAFANRIRRKCVFGDARIVRQTLQHREPPDHWLTYWEDDEQAEYASEFTR